MVTLRIVGEPLLAPRPGGTRRYAANLTRQLIARAPAGCDVEAIAPKLTPDELDAFVGAAPGLSRVAQAPLKRDPLATSWRRGLLTGAVGGGFIHAMSLYAPIRDISLAYGIDQTVVTVHDTSALRRPELHEPAEAKFDTAMLRRAYRFASAVVTPTNAVADELTEFYDFGDRLRVVGGAADPAIALPESEAEGDRIAESIGLPDDYVLTLATPEPRKGLEPLLRAFARRDLEGARLVVVGPTAHGERTTEQLLASAGVEAGRVTLAGTVGDAELAVALQRASALVVPSIEAGFGLPMVEAFRFGTPLVISDAPALREVAMDAALVVERGDGGDAFAERLAGAIASVLGDADQARRLRIASRDRAGVHHWEASADRVWALHADL